VSSAHIEANLIAAKVVGSIENPEESNDCKLQLLLTFCTHYEHFKQAQPDHWEMLMLSATLYFMLKWGLSAEE